MFYSGAIVAALALVAGASAASHTIIVGNKNGDTIYTPPYVYANPGDNLIFQFQQKNHSVVQSSFSEPCTSNGGFNSGFFPVPANQTSDFPTYTVPVKDKNPIWVYCAQAANLPNSHCGAGMVFAANPAGKFDQFKNKALAIGAALKASASSSSAPPSKTTSAYGVRHTVVVGDSNGDTIYTPPFLDANPGDELVFQFKQKNHSATQSSFNDPCTSNGGFNSGFFPVPPGQNYNFPTYTVPVKDKNPIWVYCAQNAGLANSHCGAGMVFAANPGNKFDAFKQKALAIGAALKAANGTTTAPPTTHTVVVGDSKGDTIYTPPFLNANVGDKVVFQFQQKNHSVVQSSFNDPCTSDGGFNSGFFPVPPTQTSGFPTFSIEVKDKNPVWAYCAQNAGLNTSHCGAGMVFSVNPGNKFDAFKQKALAIGAALKAGNGTSTGSAPPTTHTVVVGDSKGDTIYTPLFLNANPGDKVLFQFQQKNHSVVQSSFNDPCTSINGFNSGFFPVPANQTSGFPTFTIDVKDKKPVWAYCAQAANLPNSHCGAGMVFAVNPGHKFYAFKDKALAIGAALKAANGSEVVTITKTVTVTAPYHTEWRTYQASATPTKSW